MTDETRMKLKILRHWIAHIRSDVNDALHLMDAADDDVVIDTVQSVDADFVAADEKIENLLKEY